MDSNPWRIIPEDELSKLCYDADRIAAQPDGPIDCPGQSRYGGRVSYHTTAARRNIEHALPRQRPHPGCLRAVLLQDP